MAQASTATFHDAAPRIFKTCGMVGQFMARDLERLLIVEDERPFASELKADGERLGLAVKVVHDSSTFEEVLSSWVPTIIAMDLMMPRSDGLELLQVCERHADTSF
jgi:CheY-like chemotaxis protein